MISLKTVTAIFLGATLCTAQTINISGTVKNAAGVGISGATIKLEVANISTTSGADGSFTLTNGSTQIQPKSIRNTATTNLIQIHHGKISFTLSGNTNVGVSIHDVGGRRIYNSNRIYSSGTHAIKAPQQSTGIFIYKINIGDESYSFKSSPFGAFSTERSAALGNGTAFAKQARAMAIFADVITVRKEGQLNYRDSIKASDKAGIVITMIPSAGNVADADGNVYQSVQIGNQVWTIENLRTTKYNDSTAIPGPIFTKSEWKRDTPAYCWYGDSTGAAYREKWGALYNWYVVAPTNPKKIAPVGWHVPTDAEWTILIEYLIANGYNWDGTTTGNKIAKSIASRTDWITATYGNWPPGNNPTLNNRSGFSALPGGWRESSGGFYDQNEYGRWWSATEDNSGGAILYSLGYPNESLYRISRFDDFGFSVRLIRD